MPPGREAVEAPITSRSPRVRAEPAPSRSPPPPAHTGSGRPESDPTPPEGALAAILRRARERRGIAIAQAADAANVGLHTLLGWEAGIAVPRLDGLARLAGVIGLDLGDLSGAGHPGEERALRYERFGVVFRRARERRGLSEDAVARAVGVSAPALHRWEKGTGLPQTKWVPRLARCLGLYLGEVDAVLGAPAAPVAVHDEDEDEKKAPAALRPAAIAIGVLLRARRDARRWSRGELARRTGIATANLVFYEKGLNVPGAENLGRLAWALDLDLGDLEPILSPWAAARRRWEHLGLALRLARERRDWTREDVAERAGLRVALVGGWEENAEASPLRTLGALADALGLGLGELDELLAPHEPRAERFERIGPALKSARELRGVDRQELARRTGIRLTLIGRWDAGGVPKVGDFGLLAAALELRLGDLDAALDDAAAWVRVERVVGVDADLRRLARELLGGVADPSLATERHVGVLLAAVRAVAGAAAATASGARLESPTGSTVTVPGGG